MTTLITKNENEALEVLMGNLDDSKTITDEFLAKFAGVNKSDFNRRADQLEKHGIVSIFAKISAAESKSVREPTPKITRKYLLLDIILILSQYKNHHQIRALKLCKLALNNFVNDSMTNKVTATKNSTIPVPLYMEDMFGGLVKIGSTIKNILDLNYEDLIEAKLIHIQKVMSGLQKKQELYSDELMQIKNSKINKAFKALRNK